MYYIADDGPVRSALILLPKPDGPVCMDSCTSFDDHGCQKHAKQVLSSTAGGTNPTQAGNIRLYFTPKQKE